MNPLLSYRAPLLLAAVVIAAFIAQQAVPGFTEAFMLESAEVGSRPWILLTSIFLHSGPLHLFYNMLALVLFGLVLEQIIGRKRFYALFFAGGIFAGLVAVPLYNTVLGASGAVFAVLGCLAVLRPRMTVWIYMFPMPMAAAAVLWFLIDMVGLIAPSNIANASHIAGLLFGVAFGLAARMARTGREYRFIYKRGRLLTEKEIDEWEDRWMA